MAGAQTSDVDLVLKEFLTDNPSVIGFVVINGDGIPVKWHEGMAYERAITIAALLSDFVFNSKKGLRELLNGDKSNTPSPESELANVRLRTKDGTEIICVSVVEYTIVVIQNCTGKPFVLDEEGGDAVEGAG